MPLPTNNPNMLTKPKFVNPVSGPIPGESLTIPPGQYPFDRPPQFADPEEALDNVMQNMLQPDNAQNLLALMEAGFPLTLLGETILTSGFREGKWSAHMMYLMAPPLGVILAAMAKAAKISYKVTTKDGKFDLPNAVKMLAQIEAQIKPEQVNAAVSAGQAEEEKLDAKAGEPAEDDEGEADEGPDSQAQAPQAPVGQGLMSR